MGKRLIGAYVFELVDFIRTHPCVDDPDLDYNMVEWNGDDMVVTSESSVFVFSSAVLGQWIEEINRLMEVGGEYTELWEVADRAAENLGIEYP